jgi:nuclear pore complex protein Nup210
MLEAYQNLHKAHSALSQQNNDAGFLQVSIRSASGRTIESKFVRVSVYAPLSLHPPEIVLAPGADYAIQVQGGPRSSAQVVLSSSDTTIVSVDPVLGLVRGEKEGQAEVRAQAPLASGQVLSEAAMTVVVRKLVKAGLHVGTGRLGVGEEMAVFPEGGERGEDLMSFGQVCYGYRWSVGDAEVLQVQRGEALEVPESRGGDPVAELDPGFSVRLAGKTPGRTTVSLTFKCRYGPLGTQPVDYNASANILVVDDIPVNRGCCATWLLPPHYETSFSLPYFECCGPETTMYSVLQSCPPPNQDNNYVVKLVDEGRLQTGSRPDVECIHARVRSTGRAGLAACVRVAEIAEVRINSA